MSSLGRSDPKQVSAMIRVKDEEEFLYPSVRSIVDDVEEIVLIDNGSHDRTPAIIESLKREYSNKVVCYRYNHEVRRQGWESWELASRCRRISSPHLLADYYNWCLQRCTKPFILKWDGDMIATDILSEAMREWRLSYKPVMSFNGVNVHPDRQHLLASQSTDRKELTASLKLPEIPEWVTSLTHTSRERHIFPKFRATFDMGNKFCERLCTPVSQGWFAFRRRYEVKDACFLHLKFCKREPYSGYSSELAEVISSNVAAGPPLRSEWLDLLRRSQVNGWRQ